jgi:voltage-gated potassium channel
MKRLTLVQAFALVAAATAAAVVLGGIVVSLVEPERFPDVFVGLWWALSTVTTVGYGDFVPQTHAGRVIGGLLMLVGISALAAMTAVVASIIVREVSAEEAAIEREESEILELLRVIEARLDRLEHAGERESASSSRAPSARAA